MLKQIINNPFTGDTKTDDIVRNGYLQIYIDSGIITSNYGLCSLVRVRNQNSDGIHIIFFDKPSSTTKVSVSSKRYTFCELSYIDTFPQDRYVPNPPKLTSNLITQLISRTWNPLDITQLLYIIISLHANTDLIQEIINSNLPIDWGYIDSKGNTFLHKACIHPKSEDFLLRIIQVANTRKNQLINHSNNAKQTPLALLTRYINKNTSYSTYHEALNILLKHGSKILIQDLNTQIRRPIMEKFTLQQHNQSLVITFTVQQSRLHGNFSMYALISKPYEIFVIKTGDLTSSSQEDFFSNFSKNFITILDLNCPEIIDYIFDPKNSISKTNIDQPQTRESFLNVVAGECNSPLLFEHFIQDITNWNPKNPKENILHICLSKKKYENFYLLLEKIPLIDLNKLLFTTNYANLNPITSMMDIPNSERCTRLISRKGCLDHDGNNLAHISILSKKYHFFVIVIKCSETQKNIFTHKNNDGFNPLHLAIQKSLIEATLLLLENSDKSILTSRDNDGYNCLHSAIIHFNIDIFKAVLGVVIKCDAVSEEKIINIKTKDTTKTPFLLSIEKQCLEATELLLSSGASIDIQDSKSQYFPYYIQNYCINKDSLQKVLGLRVNQCKSSTLKSECCIEDFSINTSPLLFYFWQYQDLDRFKEICATFSFRNLVKCNQDGNTILHLSLYNDKLTEYLLEAFSRSYNNNNHKEETINFINIANKKCETALSLAVTHSKPEAVRKILKLGASLQIGFSGGDNILHIAIRTNNKETIAIFLCRPEIGQLLCKHNDKKETPITSLLRSDGTGAITAIAKVGKDIKGPNGESILHLVVQNGDEQTLLELFKLKGFSWSNLKDNNKRTPLHYAVVFSKAYAIKLLVEREYDIFTPDDKGNTPIQEAIERKDENVWKEMFKMLLLPNHVPQLPILLQFSVKMNNLNAMKDIFDLKPDLTSDNDNNSVIHLAAKSPEQVAVLEYLLQSLPKDKSRNMLQSLNKEELTPLHYAIYQNNVEGAKILKGNGSPIAVLFKRELSFFSKKFEGRMVLYKARHPNLRYLFGYSMKQGKEDICILTEIPKFKSTDLYKVSDLLRVNDLIPIQDLQLFFNSSCIDLISYLIHHKHVNSVYQNGITLLHYAAQFSTISIIRYLIETHKCKLFTFDKHENSILYYALQNQNQNLFEDVCELIITDINKVPSKQINLFETPNLEGKRILDICIEKKDFSYFRTLLNPKYKVKLDYIDSRGYTLFHRLILLKTSVDFFKQLHTITHSTNQYRHLSSLPAVLSKLTSLHLAISENLHEHIDFMLKKQYDLCVQSENGNYPVHVAVIYNLEKEIMEKIINTIPKEKVSLVLNAKNNESFSPILLAARNGNPCTVEALLEREYINVNAIDNLGRNALHHSILLKKDESNLESLKLFLKYKTLIKQRDSEGLTPLHYCVIQGNIQALELVLQNDKDILSESNEKKNLIHFAIESTSDSVWKRVFKELECSKDPKAIIETKLNDVTILVYCIKKNNLTAFEDILTLTPNIDAVDSEGNTPLHHAAEYPEQSQILTSLIEYIKGNYNDRLEQLFSILNNNNLAPFHYAIWKNNLSAIDMFIHHKAPFVIQKDSKSTLCALNSPLSINLSTQNNQLMIGYKVTPKSSNPPVWILSQIPDMNRDAIKKLANTITKIDRLTYLHIKTILQCPSAEPVIAFMNQKLIQESRTFDNGCSLLLFSAMYGTLSVVNELCKTMDLSFTDQNTETILFYALKNKDIEVLKFLLNSVLALNGQRSTDILNAENKKGERILEVALDNFDKFSILLDGKFQIILTYTAHNECTLLHTIMRSKRDPKFIFALLTEIERRKPDSLNKFINISSKDVPTALHLCICNNLEDNLRELLKFSPNITCQDQNGNTPLHIASELNYKTLVTILIEHVKSIQGDYLSFINAVNKEKMTPLHLSIISSNLEIAKELLTAGAELYATDHSGKTVLHHAVLIRNEIKRENAINFIFQQENEKADPERKLIQIQDSSDNDSPLHLAVKYSNNKTIQLLLKESPDLTLCDKHKKSVLHKAIAKGNLEIIQSILDYIIKAYPKERSDPLHVLNLQDEDGNTALHLAINSSSADILEALLPLNPLMNLKNISSGQTPLHLAVSEKPVILNDILVEINKYSKEEKDSYFYALDNTGLPPLHSAIVHNHLQSVRALIDSGVGLVWHENEATFTLFNDKMKSPLCFYIVKKGFFDYFKFFSSDQILVGYKMEAKGKSIVTELPDLTKTTIIDNEGVIELEQLSEKNIINLLKCPSTEPIQVAIEKKLVDDKKFEPKKGNWLANLASKEGNANVSAYLLSRGNMPIKEFCQAIEQGVKNITFSNLLDKAIPTTHNYQTISELTDGANRTDTFIHHVSITLCEAMNLSLDNETNDALNKLLSFNPCLNYAYGEKKDSTLLHLMVEKNKSSEFLKEYLEKVKVMEEQNPNSENRIIDSKNSNSMTALNLSIKMKQLNNIESILSYQPDAFLCDASNNSSLHFSTETGNLEITQLIFGYISDRNPSYSFDNKNYDGCTPLHLAAESGNEEICELLLAKGADCYSTDNSPRTILHHAILIRNATQRKSMVEFILHKTVNSDNKIVRMPDNQSCIPLQCAVTKGQLSVVELLVPFTDTIKHRNIDKQTALHLSCIHRCDKIVDLIVEEIIKHRDGNVIDLMDKNLKTALLLSIENKNHHALEEVLKAKPNLELIDASKNTYLHNAIEVVNDPFFLNTILSNLSENTMKNLFTRLNNIELPPLQYAILYKNYLAADILVGKGAKLGFLKEGKSRLCDDTDKLKLKVVKYKSQCWVGFEIQTATKKSHFVITQLPSLEGDTYVSANESHNIKPYIKETVKDVMRHISACKSSDPFNNLLQNGLISLEDNFQEIGKFATKVVIQKFFDSNKHALYHQASGESMIESAVSNPNLDAFEFLLSNLPEFQQKDISSVNPTDSKDAQISLCVKNSLRKSLSNTNTKILKSLLKRFTKINYLYPNEETLIQLAISQGNSPDFLEAIFEKVGKDSTETDIAGISLINKQSKYKEQTALHICIAKKQKDNLGVLLNNSAGPFLCDSEANTALHYSVLTNDLHFVETVYNATKEKSELLQQTNVDNHSALHLAVKGENPKIVDFLLRSSSPFYPVMDKEPTLLHLAIRIGNESAQTEIMNQLFKHEDAGHVKFPMTQLKDDRGYPPLHLATDLRNNNAVTLLLKTDPSVLYIQDTRGHTPLHISLIQSTSGIKVEVKYFSIFETIIGKILALRDENPDLLAQNVITPPLHEETPCTCKVDNVFCTQDKHGRTAMHYAIQYGRIEAFKQLLKTKSCLFIPDEDGYTLQHEAVKNGSDIQFLELLEEELMARTGGSHLECFKFKRDCS